MTCNIGFGHKSAYVACIAALPHLGCGMPLHLVTGRRRYAWPSVRAAWSVGTKSYQSPTRLYDSSRVFLHFCLAFSSGPSCITLASHHRARCGQHCPPIQRPWPRIRLQRRLELRGRPSCRSRRTLQNGEWWKVSPWSRLDAAPCAVGRWPLSTAPKLRGVMALTSC